MPNRIRAARQEQDITQAQLGKLIGLSQQQVAKLEMGRQRLSTDMAERIAKALSISLHELIGLPERALIPVLGHLGANDVVARWKLTDDVERLEAPPFAPPDMIAIRVAGDGAYPLYRTGDVIFCAPPEPADELLGEECVVTLADGRSLLKCPVRGSEPGRYTLLSLTCPDVLQDAEVRECRRVEYVRKARRARVN